MTCTDTAPPRKQVRFSLESNTVVFHRCKSHGLSWLSKQPKLKTSLPVNAAAPIVNTYDTETSERIARDLSLLFDCPVKVRIDLMIRLNQDHDDVRGLERQLCDEYRLRLFRIRTEARQAVLKLQQQQRTKLASGMHMEQEDLQNELAALSNEQSHSARVLARVLAIADRGIVLAEDEEDKGDEDNKGRQHLAPRKLKSESNLVPVSKRRFSFSHVVRRHSYTAPLCMPSSLKWRPSLSFRKQSQQ